MPNQEVASDGVAEQVDMQRFEEQFESKNLQDDTQEIPVEEVRQMVVSAKMELSTFRIIECSLARGNEEELRKVVGGLDTGD